jgi:nucleoid DNA-binding protein
MSGDAPSSEKDKASEEKESPSGSGLSYIPLGSSQEKETKKPDPSPPSGSKPSPDSVQEPAGETEPETVLPEEQAQEIDLVEERGEPTPQEPEPDHQDESTRPVERKDRPKEPVAGKKSTTGEFAVFQDPKLLQPASNLRLSESGKKFFSSAEVIAELASETSRSPEEVAGVVDGFWDYVADVRRHYKEGVKHHFLAIPHFGTFRFQFKWEKGKFHPKLTFKSSTTVSAKAHRRTYSSRWADQWSGDVEGLSVRRKISVYVAERSGLPLPQADQVFNRLLRTVRELCEGGGRINWGRRGTMGTFQVTDKKERSGRNMQTGGKTTVRTGRDSITGERIPAEGNEHFSFSASEGFKERLQVPDLPDEPRANKNTASRQTGKQAKAKGCSGCLGWGCLGCVVFGLAILAITIIAELAPDREAEAIDTFPLRAHRFNNENNASIRPSPRTDVRTKIVFENKMNSQVFVHLVDSKGNLRYSFELSRNEILQRDTYNEHTWLVTDLELSPLMYFIAERRDRRKIGLAEIKPMQRSR